MQDNTWVARLNLLRLEINTFAEDNDLREEYHMVFTQAVPPYQKRRRLTERTEAEAKNEYDVVWEKFKQFARDHDCDAEFYNKYGDFTWFT